MQYHRSKLKIIILFKINIVYIYFLIDKKKKESKN